ncbi:SpoIID/LytB domain-containing protein [Alicyclobacillus cycloheptanicus]|uniref:Peptidoglycan hydrolase-like amidase n=1 Tax=Alicyclobacillus cycloheptanicus TaxID=1457 RepID=A0ABT9XFC5_9BACL|nr:SpoIID/LytB domain-containing protein [Alicyclobacillus cycloheptanicus]MDQ0188992.1 peptidoglycan hydrolase-like amidase [Alicyclobacillus cycloheptanicus]WDM01665.1 SpoIID/LytB domain-containing protein [Alicyclobacillus cycloheptanicus]
MSDQQRLRRRTPVRRLWFGLAAAAVTLVCTGVPAHAQQVYTIDNTAEPSVIRVAIRGLNPNGEPDPRGRIQWVQTVPFEQYCEDVLPNEWVPSWNIEALKAGAMAIKMFAWYHHLHPVSIDGFTFDVDNTVNFQTFRYLSRQPDTNQAVMAIRPYAYVKPDGEIIELNYRAGNENDPNWQYRNAQKMAQWGSEYWAERGRDYVQILQFYYIDRTLRQYRS